jgi:hypothetical protein
MLTAEEIGFWVDVGAGIATVVLVVIVGIQMKQTQQQIDSSLRPWIGARERLRFENQHTLLLPYTNYGQLPPKSINVRFLVADKQITQDDIDKSTNTQTLDVGTIMPNMDKELRGGVTEEQYERAMRGEPFFVIFVIRYEYAKNKKGEYGVIYYYNSYTQMFLLSREWGK